MAQKLRNCNGTSMGVSFFLFVAISSKISPFWDNLYKRNETPAMGRGKKNKGAFLKVVLLLLLSELKGFLSTRVHKTGRQESCMMIEEEGQIGNLF